MNFFSDDSPERLLQAGQQALNNDMAEAGALLLQARKHPRTRLAAHNLIERHALPGAFSEWMGVNCEISPRDDIYRFFEDHPSSVNPLRDYFADGWRTLSELLLLLESVDCPLLKIGSVLEFASGHGRFTRHLVKAIGGDAVTVSDVVADAVAFAHDTLGVNGFESTTRPEDLRWPARYGLVFVLSLFSHLPRASWGRWLRHLLDAVAPGGLLVFSTHGQEAARREGVQLDDEGFFFVTSSESQAIDAQEYGTAFTAPAFVRAQLTEWAGQARLQRFAPAWFWRGQDAWVLKKPGRIPLIRFRVQK